MIEPRQLPIAALPLSLCCLLASIGCKDAGPALAPVKGSVSFRGKPIENGTIIFVVPGQRQATGRIVAGQIGEVTTFKPNDGAPIGSATIAVFATEQARWTPPLKKPASPAEWTAESAPPMVTPSLIPTKYNDPKTSGLICEIKPERNELQLELTTDR